MFISETTPYIPSKGHVDIHTYQLNLKIGNLCLKICNRFSSSFAGHQIHVPNNINNKFRLRAVLCFLERHLVLVLARQIKVVIIIVTRYDNAGENDNIDNIKCTGKIN